MTDPERVLTFWLGEVDERGFAGDETSKRWWKKSPAFDAEIRSHFESEYEAVAAGERESWLDTPRGRLAYVIVLDQLSRNMFRGSAKMYAADERAQRAVVDGLDRGHDEALFGHERVFFYMPLMHAESLELQDRGVEVFTAFRDETEREVSERVAQNVKYAIQHRDIVAQWGRFPHRNEILGRETTPEEAAFLKQPGSSF